MEVEGWKTEFSSHSVSVSGTSPEIHADTDHSLLPGSNEPIGLNCFGGQ